MMEILLKPSSLEVRDYRIDGNLHRVRLYDSWASLFSEWGPTWTIDTRRTVWVRCAAAPQQGASA